MHLLFETLKNRSYTIGILAGLVISLPTLFFGIFLDDYIQVLTIDGKMHLGSPFDTYVFGPGDAEKMSLSRELGTHPWFALTELKLHFFRPLSSALMFLDRTLFGDFIIAYHLHSILWWLLLLLAVSQVYRISIGGTLGPLAMLLFALDEAHVLPVAWWANRNSLVAACFVFSYLAAHLAWRERNWHLGRIIAPILLVLGFLASEVAVGIMGYVIAYEIFGRDAPLSKRLAGLVVPGTISIAYLIFYITQNYGVYGSGVYMDPIHQPLEFFAWAPGRLFVLLGTQFAMLPAEAVIAFPFSFAPLSILGLMIFLFVLWLLRKAWPDLDDHQRRAVRWLLPGMLISALPVLATFPSMRLLMLPSLGGAAILAIVFEYAWRKSLLSASTHWKKLVWCFVGLHLIFAPLVWWITVATATGINRSTQQEYFGMDVGETRGKHIILLQSSNPVLSFYLKVFQLYYGNYEADSWHCLSWASFDHKLTRVSDNAFELELIGGQMLGKDYESIFRSPAFGFSDGDEVKLRAFTAKVLESGDIGPKRIRFIFDRSLDDTSKHTFLYNHEGVFVPFQFPAVGETVIIKKDEWI